MLKQVVGQLLHHRVRVKIGHLLGAVPPRIREPSRHIRTVVEHARCCRTDR